MSVTQLSDNISAKLNDEKALVVFSGGQDSTTCLYWSFDKWGKENTKALTFDYGQKHGIELDSAKKICEFTGLDFDKIDVKDILRSVSPLVDTKQEMDLYSSVDEFEAGVQKTFVPGRNILFLTIAANIAYHHGAKNIVLGVCEEDFGGYYDCRKDFIDAMQKALNQGLFGKDEGLILHAPLMKLNKKATVELAVNLGSECLEALSYSHTCYEGKFPPCGKCHSCLLRERGFKEANLIDPLLERKFSHATS
jgi:7-cyano-7-deazaguanine synthase